MSTPDPTSAAKQAASAFHAPPSFALFLSSLWIGLQTSTENFFGGKTEKRENLKTEATPLPPTKKAGPTAVPAFVANYARTLDAVWRDHDWSDVLQLVETLQRCWREDRQVFLCGNGGSAANAIHLANDLLYGVDKISGRGLRVTALPANAAVLTCLANDIAYEDIFAQQLTVLAHPGDVLIAFSGSGNSPNIVKALARARELGVTSFAVLGFTGGRALALAE